MEIDVSFFSSGYLDVSVHRVPDLYLWIQYRTTEVSSAGFPHSDIHGSKVICTSPWLFAAYHVFLRLLVPRHPPCALSCLTVRSPAPAGSLACIALHARSFLSLNTLFPLLRLRSGMFPSGNFHFSQSEKLASDVLYQLSLIFKIVVQYSVFKVQLRKYIFARKFAAQTFRFLCLHTTGKAWLSRCFVHTHWR